jgi:membrane protease YdiL (CAAX protease family)
MVARGRFYRDVAWKGTIREGGMGPGTPAMTGVGRGTARPIQEGAGSAGTVSGSRSGMEPPADVARGAGRSWLPLVALVARPALSLAAQSGVALVLRARGRPQPFRRAAGWWMVYGTAVDAGCVVLLATAAHREGVPLQAAAEAAPRPRRSVAAGSLDVAALVPTAIVSQLLGRRLGPDPADPYPPQIRVSRLRGAARLHSLTAWPVLWAACEEATYLGYALPQLERRYGTGPAACLVSLAWAAQHAVMPALPGHRYAISRVVAMVPVTAAFTTVFLARGRKTVPLIAAHWASDLSAAVLAASLAAREARHDGHQPASRSRIVGSHTSNGRINPPT